MDGRMGECRRVTDSNHVDFKDYFLRILFSFPFLDLRPGRLSPPPIATRNDVCAAVCRRNGSSASSEAPRKGKDNNFNELQGRLHQSKSFPPFF